MSIVWKRSLISAAVALVLTVAVVGCSGLRDGAGNASSAREPASSSFTRKQTDAPADHWSDITGTVGEKWSNAQKIMQAAGVDTSQLVVLTEDGRTVIMPSNWTVESFSKKDGSVFVHLRRTTTLNDAGDAAGSAASKAAGSVRDSLTRR
jgi:hypothetical protein